MNFHVGGCEPSPASTIFPVLVSVEPAVSLAWKCRLCPASAANGSFLFKAPSPGAAEQDAWSGGVEVVCGGGGGDGVRKAWRAVSGAGGRARQASVVDDVGCVCLREGGGAALGIPQERWRCKQGECCDRRRYGL